MTIKSVSAYEFRDNPFANPVLDKPELSPEGESSNNVAKDLQDPLLNPPSHDLLLDDTEEGLTSENRGSRASFDELRLPPRPPETRHTYTKWAIRGAGVATAAGFLILRVMDCSRKINAWSSFMVGLGGGIAYEAGRTDVNHSWWTKYAITAFGETFILFQTQIYANVKNPVIQAMNVHSIIGASGFLAAVLIYQLALNGFALRSEGHAGAIYSGKKLQPPIFSPAASNVFKMAAIGGATALHFIFTDPTAKSLALFFVSAYSGQLVGFLAAKAIDKMIERPNKPEQMAEETMKGSWWLVGQTGLNTLGSVVAIPLVLVPVFTDAKRVTHETWFPIMGGVLGLFEEFIFRNFQARLHTYPISQQGELQEVKAPGEKEKERTGKVPLKLKLHNKIWRVAVPIFVALSFTGFTVWQDGFDLHQADLKAELGTMLGLFLATLGAAHYADRKWELGKEGWKQYFIEKMMTSLLISPRILGFNPMDFYFVGITAYTIGSQSPQADDTVKKVVATASFAFLGIAWALEFVRTWGSRRGTALYFPMLGFINGLTMMERSYQGLDGVP